MYSTTPVPEKAFYKKFFKFQKSTPLQKLNRKDKNHKNYWRYENNLQEEEHPMF